jgi:type II secretory pathway component PulF
MYPAVLTIVLVGIVLGVGLYVLSTFHDNIATSRTGTQNGINTSTGTTTLTAASLTNFNMSSLTVVFTNGTSPGTNYTFAGNGTITWGANIVADQSSLVNTTYVYIYDATSSPEAAVTTTITGLATFADWIAIIVVVIAAAIVLGIVLMSFGRRRNSI